MKKFICLVISLFLIIGMVPITASAEIQTVTQDSITYKIDTEAGTAYIDDADNDIVTADILSEINGYPVTSIGDNAFENCVLMTEAVIPDSITSIGNRAFGLCDQLTSIKVSENNKNYSSLDGVLFNKDKTELIQYPGGKAGEYIIPDTVTSIGDQSFELCYSLTSITIPNSVISIGYNAFYWCDSLKSVTIPDSVASISKGAFVLCTSLKEVSIPDSVASIGVDAFSSTAYYRNLSNWENGMLYIDNHFIKAKSDISGEYTIKDGTKVIANSAFSGCNSLTSVTIPSSVTRIGGSTFSGCNSLKEVTIPDSVTSIGDCAFYNCASLTSVTIPDSVTSIGESAFSGCNSLKEVTIPHSVTSIGESTFSDCTSLTSVTIPDYVTSIGYRTFYNCASLTSINIPNSVTSIGEDAFCWCISLTDVYYSGGESDWNNISIGYSNYYLTSATIHYGKTDEQPTTTEPTTTTPTQPTTPQGDVNGDGKLSIADARSILISIANNDRNADTIAIADLNSDGKISILDARLVLVKIANGEV